MKTAFSLSESELKLCLLAMGAAALLGTEVAAIAEDETQAGFSAADREKLFGKEILVKTAKGAEFSIGAGTTLVTALHPAAHLDAKRTDAAGTTLCNVYLRGESIAILWKSAGEEYQLMWVPTTKLAVGALANLTRGLPENKTNTLSVPEADWSIKGFAGDNAEPEITQEIHSTAGRQTMVFNGEECEATRELCVNKAAAWLINIHGRELERVNGHE